MSSLSLRFQSRLSDRNIMSPTIPYGSWPSSISSKLLTQQSVRLGEPQITPSCSYWVESRPQEQGRAVLMQKPHSAEASEVLSAQFSVRSTAHEYGGGSYLVSDGAIFFINATDQRIYRSNHGSAPEVLTAPGPYRYADLSLDSQRQRLLCIREDHSDAGAPNSGIQERNEIIAIDLNTPEKVTVLTRGHDFYSNPRLSPDGRQLSWLCWDHPAMPWESSECWLADLDSAGEIDQCRCIAGGKGESIFQPQWSPDGVLYLVSDRSNWWNIYRHDDGVLQPITPISAEFATPQWVFGMSCFSFLNSDEILACFSQQGQWQLAHIHIPSRTLSPLDTDFCDISQVQCCDGQAIFLAASPNRSSNLFHLAKGEADGFQQQLQVIASSSNTALDDNVISTAEAITFPTSAGQQAHGFYYPPRNGSIEAPAGTAPPLIVLCHGGPTGATETGLNLKIQYWTSRGFAVMDVNYRGSTGYGRHYREQLNGYWGVYDVEDVCAAAEYLVSQRLANPEQLAIKGSSAGGYTVLAALTFANTFKAGASLYGIGNLETLATDTHKFESHYLDSLVGPYPQQRALYQQRSPLFHADQLNCPVIFFQGLDDKVVPPNQAESMVKALDQKKVAVAYVKFTGEGHGFRQAATIERCLEAEWSFYGQIFGLDVPESVTPVQIKNL